MGNFVSRRLKETSAPIPAPTVVETDVTEPDLGLGAVIAAVDMAEENKKLDNGSTHKLFKKSVVKTTKKKAKHKNG